MSAATAIRTVRPWPCEAECDAPRCREKVAYVLVFENARPVDRLYLCASHAKETERNYAQAVAS